MAETPEQHMEKVTPEVMIMTTASEMQMMHILMNDNSFIFRWLDRIHIDHWNHPYSKKLFQALSWYVKKYETLPSIHEIHQILLQFVTVDDPMKELMEYATEITAVKIPDNPEFLKDFLLDHCRAFDYKNFVLSAAVAVREKNFDGIEKELRDLAVRHQKAQIVAEYGQESVAARVDGEYEWICIECGFMFVDLLQTQKPSACPTCGNSNNLIWQKKVRVFPSHLPTLNEKHGGGYKSKAVTVFMGPSGSGKSWWLCNVGSHFLLQGFNVFHLTFELDRGETQARYDVINTGFSFEQREANPHALDQALDVQRQTGKMGKFYCIEMLTGTCSCNQVRATLEDHRLYTGDHPHVVILDYMTIMMPNNPKHVDMTRTYEKHKIIAEEVRALAQELNMPVITAVQSNRGSVEKRTIRTDDIADSWGVVHVVDLVLTINQEIAEVSCDKGRLFVAKARSHLDKYTIAYDIRGDNGRLSEDVLLTKVYNDKAQQQVDAAKKAIQAGQVPAVQPVFDAAAASASILNMAGGQALKPGRQVAAQAPPSVLPQMPPPPSGS